jgi:hypothetical protein
MLTGVQITDLPPRDFVRLLQTWIQQTNLALLAAPVGLPFLSRNQDWPTPRGAEPDWRRSWEWSYNKNLIGQDQMLTGARITDLPPPDFPRILQTWIQQTNLALLTQPPSLLPYRRAHFDLPPAGPQQAAPSWTWQYNLNLIGQDAMIVGKQSYDLAPIYPPYINQLRTWIDAVKLSLIAKPFNQQDWPNPTAPARDPTLTTWIQTVNLALTAAPALPFLTRNQDWPNPTGFARDPTLTNWGRGYNLNLIGQDQLPFRQQDWPNPRGPIQPDRGFGFGFNPNLPPPAPGPTGPAVYNKLFFAGPGYLNVIPGNKPS